MTPLGEKLIELVQKNLDGRNVYCAPDIPQKKLDSLRKEVDCPSDEEILVLDDFTLFGSAKSGMLCTETGVYIKFVFGKAVHKTYDELLTLFKQDYSESIGDCVFLGKEYAVQLSGYYWSEFFEFYAKYMGGDNPDEKQPPSTGGIKVCEYCGKKFDATLDTCPGCGASA